MDEVTAVDISVTRYLSVAGYAVLVYDTFLTFSDEVEFIWRSKNNVAKWALLVNKYIVLAILTLVNLELSGLTGILWTDFFCRSWISAHAIMSVISIAMSNALVLLRVMALWEHRKIITKILFTILLSTTLASLVSLIMLLSVLIPQISYSPIFQVCGVDPFTNTHPLGFPWGLPLLFDLTAAVMTIWNALDRPRDMNAKVAAILRQDGLFYFFGLAILRLFNVAVIAGAPTSLLFLAGYFTWAMVTTIMNRFLIRLRRSQKGDTAADEDHNDEIPLRLTASKNSLDSSYSRFSVDTFYYDPHKKAGYWFP